MCNIQDKEERERESELETDIALKEKNIYLKRGKLLRNACDVEFSLKLNSNSKKRNGSLLTRKTSFVTIIYATEYS